MLTWRDKLADKIAGLLADSPSASSPPDNSPTSARYEPPQAVDAIDNGISQYDTDQLPRYVISSKFVPERPLSGSQVPFCPVEKKILDCWTKINPGTFRVRGQNYLRDKKKEFAPNHAAYCPFGVDVYLSQQKISHIARFVLLPTINSSSKLPQLLVVNVQVHALAYYAISYFPGDSAGLKFLSSTFTSTLMRCFGR